MSERAAQCLRRLGDMRRITDADLADVLHDRDDVVVAAALGALASRCILTPAQADWLLARIHDRLPDADYVWRQIMALKILRDGHRTPTSRLRHLLDIGADWAAALIVDEIGPFECGKAFAIVNESSRPNAVKSTLCAAVAAHQNALWADRTI